MVFYFSGHEDRCPPISSAERDGVSGSGPRQTDSGWEFARNRLLRRRHLERAEEIRFPAADQSRLREAELNRGGDSQRMRHNHKGEMVILTCQGKLSFANPTEL